MENNRGYLKLKVKMTKITLLDWDDAIAVAKSRGVITKKEADIIHQYMTEGVSYTGNHYPLHWGDIEEGNGMEGEGEEEAFKKFYGLYVAHEVDSEGEFPCIYFDCTGWN